MRLPGRCPCFDLWLPPFPWFRYLTHIMRVATPTKDCFELTHELLAPVLEASADDALTRQEVSLRRGPWRCFGGVKRRARLFVILKNTKAGNEKRCFFRVARS